MLLFASIAIFAATAAPVQVEDLEVADCENEAVLYDENEVLDTQEIVFEEELEEGEPLFEEN